MATQYGYRTPVEHYDIWCPDRAAAETWTALPGYTLIAREVSEPRIVSIRA